MSPATLSCACLNLCLVWFKAEMYFFASSMSPDNKPHKTFPNKICNQGLRITSSMTPDNKPHKTFPTKIFNHGLRITNVSRDTDQGCSGIGSRIEPFKCLRSCCSLSFHKTTISLINTSFSARRASLISRRLSNSL